VSARGGMIRNMPDDHAHTYPHGVPCWVDTEQPDPPAARSFYGNLFEWQFTEAVPAGAPGTYSIATVDGHDVAAVGQSDHRAQWSTYICVDDADASAAAVLAAGGSILSDPYEAGPGGRTATCHDPVGAAFRLWQPRQRLGAQLVNAPRTWNFSHLHTSDPSLVRPFYAEVFGWEMDALPDGSGVSIRVPGYGQHLASTVDPGIFERQTAAPPGFADVIGGMQVIGSDEASHWHVTFSVADRDVAIRTAEQLGAALLSTSETPWSLLADLRDLQGAEFTISQYRPPS